MAGAVVLAAGVLVGLGVTGNLPALTAEGRAKAEREQKREALNEALTQLATNSPAFSVAVLDKVTGEQFSYRGSEKFDTASVVKTSVLACTLLHAQDESRQLTADEQAKAERMIRASDNDATTALFKALGAVDGLTRCDERLGMRETTVDPAWGLTKTTADDQVRLLGNLVSDNSELGVDYRQQAFDLMETVNDDQNWGVPSVGREGESLPVKNGWDTRDADGGLWVINSEGRVVSPDRSTNVSIAILSHDNASMDAGIALVERVAGLTRQHLTY